MKIEILRETAQFTGALMHTVRIIDNKQVTHTVGCRTDYNEAEKLFEETLVKIKEFPKTRYEIIRSVEYNEVK